jgi:hypothetical protein
MKKKTLIAVLGWYGMLAILIAFTCVSFEILRPTNIVYQLLSLTGALGLVVNSYSKHAYPSEILNLVFALVALISLLRIVF